MRGQPGYDTRLHARLPPSCRSMDALMISQQTRIVALVCKLRGSLMCLTFFDMLSMGFCTTRHWQTSGRIVQELNVPTLGGENHRLSTCNCLTCLEPTLYPGIVERQWADTGNAFRPFGYLGKPYLYYSWLPSTNQPTNHMSPRGFVN